MIARNKIIKIHFLGKLYLVTQKYHNSFGTWFLLQKKKKEKKKKKHQASFTTFQSFINPLAVLPRQQWTSPPPMTSATITVPNFILESTNLQTQFPVKSRESPTELMGRFMGHWGKPTLLNPQWGAGPPSWGKEFLNPRHPHSFCSVRGSFLILMTEGIKTDTFGRRLLVSQEWQY